MYVCVEELQEGCLILCKLGLIIDNTAFWWTKTINNNVVKNPTVWIVVEISCEAYLLMYEKEFEKVRTIIKDIRILIYNFKWYV